MAPQLSSEPVSGILRLNRFGSDLLVSWPMMIGTLSQTRADKLAYESRAFIERRLRDGVFDTDYYSPESQQAIVVLPQGTASFQGIPASTGELLLATTAFATRLIDQERLQLILAGNPFGQFALPLLCIYDAQQAS
jgi:hypothetical protein